jgi:hypothetical protein
MISGAVAYSIVMLACFALVWGGIGLIAKRRDRTRGILMLVAAAVLFGNVLVWVVPVG